MAAAMTGFDDAVEADAVRASEAVGAGAPEVQATSDAAMERANIITGSTTGN